MKYMQALEKIKDDHSLVFEAEEDGFEYELCADGNGFHAILLQGLIDIGNPWFLFELDWKEVKK